MKKRKKALQIVQRLRESGFKALLVGGCVRDMVMGEEPKDYDIATDATPQEVMKLFRHAIDVGAQFGVVRILDGDDQFEVATFRTDGLYRDGRHPEHVTFSSEWDDVMRRDFTINGLLYDPIADGLIDYVGGQDDIRRRIIRTIGNPYRRFEEDKLRLMRGVRFSSRYQYTIEAQTFQAMKALAEKITQVSAERIRDELLIMLTQGRADKSLKLLHEVGLLRQILPEVAAMDGVQQPPEFHPEGDVLTHTIMMAGMMANPSPELAMAVLLHDVGKPATFVVKERIRFDGHDKVGAVMAEQICRRLRFSNKSTEQIVELVEDHLRFMHVQRMRSSRLKRFLRKEGFEEHLELHRLDCLASHGKLDSYLFCVEKLQELKEEIKPQKLISGDDLIEMGFIPGPFFKKILTYVEDAQLDGKVSTREEALCLVGEKFGTCNTKLKAREPYDPFC
ncbi:MAG: CCA tRNA nucleotidyltransferase [Candidatus Tectomicrobia bacterium]|nr:CCA tRNA nucleotidyltransferase [Candidatus Tectomicrobia bacterium]